MRWRYWRCEVCWHFETPLLREWSRVSGGDESMESWWRSLELFSPLPVASQEPLPFVPSLSHSFARLAPLAPHSRSLISASLFDPPPPNSHHHDTLYHYLHTHCDFSRVFSEPPRLCYYSYHTHTRKMAHRVSQLACVFVLVALMTISLAPSTMTQAPCGQPCQNSNQCGGTCTWCNNGVCSRGKPCNSPVRITRDHTRTRACLTR